LLLVSPSNIAVWAWGGFYLSLMPSLVREVAGVSSVLLGCLVVSILMFSGAGAILALGGKAPRRVLPGGIATMMAAGSVIGGFGFGGLWAARKID